MPSTIRRLTRLSWSPARSIARRSSIAYESISPRKVAELHQNARSDQNARNRAQQKRRSGHRPDPLIARSTYLPSVETVLPPGEVRALLLERPAATRVLGIPQRLQLGVFLLVRRGVVRRSFVATRSLGLLLGDLCSNGVFELLLRGEACVAWRRRTGGRHLRRARRADLVPQAHHGRPFLLVFVYVVEGRRLL